MNLDEKLLENTAFGRAALKKLGNVPEDFRIYFASLQGKHPNYHGMQVKGAEFRRAKRGPNKGQLRAKLPQTERTAYVSTAEIDAESPTGDNTAAFQDIPGAREGHI